VRRFSSRPSEAADGGEEPYSRRATNPGRGIAPVSAKNAALLLPNATACENGLAKVIAFLPERRKRRQDVELPLPKVVADIALAERFQGLLHAGKARSRADLARRFRLTRARVTQLMKLLDLHPSILAYVRALPNGTPAKMMTERGLREIVRLPNSQQVQTAKRIVWGFQDFIAKTGARVA
jgi:hypothetical protein